MPEEISSKGKFTVKNIGVSQAVIISINAVKGENLIEIKL